MTRPRASAFWIVWASQSISVLGSGVTLFVLTLWLTKTRYPDPAQKQALATALATLYIAASVPALIAAPIAGSWVDRHDRRRVMLIADLGQGVLAFVVAALIVADAVSLPVLAAIAAIAATLGQFHIAAFDASYGLLVPEAELGRANGLMQLSWALSSIAAPIVAAALVAIPSLLRRAAADAWLAPIAGLADGSALAIAVDGATFLLAFAALCAVRFAPQPLPEGRRGLRADLGDALRFIRTRPALGWLLATFAMANLVVGAFTVLEPMVVRFALDWAARGKTLDEALAIVVSATGAGAVIGGGVMSATGGMSRRRALGVIVPLLAGAGAMILFGTTSRLYVAAVMCGILFALTTCANIQSQAIWQSTTPTAMQGRVFAVRRVLAQSTRPAGILLGGVLGGAYEAGAVIVILGAVLMGFCVIPLLRPAVMRIPATGPATGPTGS